MVTLGEGGTVAALGRSSMHQTLLYWCLTRDIAAVIPYRVIYDFFDTKSEKLAELIITTAHGHKHSQPRITPRLTIEKM